MATTTAEKIAALEDALASGARTVRFADGHSIEYRSVEEIRQALHDFRTEAGETTGPKRLRVVTRKAW